MEYISSFLIILVISIFGLILFKKLRILDRPGADLKNTRKPVPTLQGIFTYISFRAVILIIFPSYISNPVFLGLSLGVLPIILVEFVEELAYMGRLKFRIHPALRLLIHIFSAFLAVYISGIGIGQEFVILDYVIHVPQWGFMIFFAIWSVLCINAVNWMDGIYAQASGLSAIGFLTIFILLKFIVLQYYTVFNNLDVLLIVTDLSFVLFLISLLYAVIEYKPLGLVRDVGIMLFGFALAYLSVAGGAKIGTIVVALSLVIFDFIWVVLYRILVLKKSPMKGDYTHLHHRFLGLGRTRSEARAFVWIWSIIMMILILMQGANRLNKVIIFILMFLIFFGLNYYLFIIKKLPCGLKRIEKE